MSHKLFSLQDAHPMLYVWSTPLLQIHSAAEWRSATPMFGAQFATTFGDTMKLRLSAGSLDSGAMVKQCIK